MIKVLLGLVIAVLLLLVGKALFNAPLPNISLGGEKVIADIYEIEALGAIGNFSITNTMLAAWVTVSLLLIVSLIATRNMKLIPSGIQAVLEWTIEGLLKLVEEITGSKSKARKIFPLIATIFLFVLISNWTGLLPFYNGFGKTVSAEHLIVHTAEDTIKLNLVDMDDESAHHLADEFYHSNLTDATIAEIREHDHLHFPEEGDKVTTAAALNDKIMAKLKTKKLFIMDKTGGVTFLNIGFKAESLGGLGLGTDKKEVNARNYFVTVIQEKFDPTIVDEAHDIEGQKEELGLVDVHEDDSGTMVAAEFIPYFRSANSDLMMTLSIAFVAMFMVEFWGFTSNGLKGYGGRFINFSDFKKGPFMGMIGLGVGVLEAISEVARLVSFTFRLFGNILAGEILIFVFLFLLPLFAVIVPLGLEVFVGFIQAIVFSGLILVFATGAMESHEAHGESPEGHHTAPGHSESATHKA